MNRAPWQPNNSKQVLIGECGHVEISWNIIRRLGRMADQIWCDRCQAWRDLWRDLTLADLIGVNPCQLPEDPPF